MAKKVDLPEPIIPNDSWKVVKLGQYVKILNGYPFDSSRFTNSNENTYPLIRIRDVVRGYTETFTDEDCPDEYKIKKGEILIGMDGDFNISRWKSDFGLLNQRVCKISTVSKDLDEKFLFYYLPIPLKLINDATPSVTVKHLSSTSLQELHFPLPTLAEQQRIVNRIESMFDKLDEAKETVQNVVDGFETRKAAILHKAFTGELTANWRKENGVRDDSWVVKTIGEIASKITDGEHSTPKRVEQFCGFYLLSARNIHNGEIRLDDVDFVTENEYERIRKRCNPNKNDILISCSGSIGRVCVIQDNNKYVMVRSAAMVKLLQDNPFYIAYMLQSFNVQQQIEKTKKQSCQANLFLGAIKQLLLPVPTLPEQVEIVRILDIIIEKENKAKQAAGAVLDQIALLKKSILARAFRGEL